MFVETGFGQGHGGTPICMSCEMPIVAGEKTVTVHFDPDDEHGLSRMNGLYHADCAAPLATVIRAICALRYRPF